MLPKTSKVADVNLGNRSSRTCQSSGVGKVMIGEETAEEYIGQQEESQLASES
jgi:hypothetical protein